jgi:catechol 2,3-dioxygenase-like lactoylglutathione lyase family enzyme
MLRPMTVALALALAVSAQSVSAQSAGNPATINPASVRIRYMVNDVSAAVAFYEGKLGFKLDMQSGPYFAALTKGGVQLLLSPTKGPGGASQPMPDGQRPLPGGWNRIVLYVPDVQGEVDRLRKSGVAFRNQVVAGPGGKEILLEDPSGNPVELFQPG